MMPKPNQNKRNVNVNKNEFQGFSSENVLHETKPNFWLYSDNFILKIIVLFLLVLMFAPIMTFIYEIHSQLMANFHIAIDNVMFYAEIVIILCIVVVIIKLILDILDWNYTNYIFTDARIIIERGFIHKEKLMISYSKIQDIEIRQSLLERVISVGDIIIYGANELSETILDDIPSPKKVEDIIINCVNNNSFTNQNVYPNNYQQYNNPYPNQQGNYNNQYNQQGNYNNQYPNQQNNYGPQNMGDDYQYIQPDHNDINQVQYYATENDVITPDRQEQEIKYENRNTFSKSKPNKEEVFRKHDEMFKRHKK